MIRVIAVGDSITHGWAGTGGYCVTEETWLYRLMVRLGETAPTFDYSDIFVNAWDDNDGNVNDPNTLIGTKYTMLNSGVNGDDTVRVLSGRDAQVARWIPDVLDRSPNIVIICFGTNDLGIMGGSGTYSAENTANRILGMADDVIATGGIPILARIPSWNADSLTWITALNDFVEAGATSRGLNVLDMFTAVCNPDGTKKSGMAIAGNVHLTAQGNQAVADAFDLEWFALDTPAILLNLHNRGGATGDCIVRVPHANGRGLTRSGVGIPVDIIGLNTYCKIDLTSDVYTPDYAEATLDPVIDPASVWGDYHDLQSLPSGFSNTGQVGGGGIVLQGAETLARPDQSLSNIYWGFDIVLLGATTISIGDWSVTLTPDSKVITYSTGAVDQLSVNLAAGYLYGVLIEQRQTSTAQEATTVLRLGSQAVLTDNSCCTFNATGDLSISGGCVVSKWRQGTCLEVNPTLSLVSTRTGSVATGNFLDVLPDGTITENPDGGAFNFQRNGTTYQLVGHAGYISKKTVGSLEEPPTVLTVPDPVPSAGGSVQYQPMGHWSFAEDSRGYLYMFTYSIGNYAVYDDVEQMPIPGPALYRSKQDGDVGTWEKVPVKPNIYDRGRDEGVQARHGHSIYYHPDHDVLYATYGEQLLQSNILKFTRLGSTDVDDVVCEYLPRTTIKGTLGANWDGQTSVFYCPPDHYPPATMRLDAANDSMTFNPHSRGLFSTNRFFISAIPTKMGTLRLSDSSKILENSVVTVAYSSVADTVEDVSLVYETGKTSHEHSHHGFSFKDMDDILYLGVEHPPTGMKAAFMNVEPSADGSLVHEYWNGTSWQELSTFPHPNTDPPRYYPNFTSNSVSSGHYISSGCAYPLDIADWVRAKASDFGFTTWSDDPFFWVRLRVETPYTSGVAPHLWWVNYAAQRALQGIFWHAEDITDSEVECAVSATGMEGMSTWKPGIPFAAWSGVPLKIDVAPWLRAKVVGSGVSLTLNDSGSVAGQYTVKRRVL